MRAFYPATSCTVYVLACMIACVRACIIDACSLDSDKALTHLQLSVGT